MISEEKDLYMRVILQALEDYEEFLQKSNPRDLSRITNLYKNSPACMAKDEDYWHPQNFVNVMNFFSSSSLLNYLYCLDIDPDSFIKNLRNYLVNKYGGIIADCVSFSFIIEGKGSVKNSAVQKECIDILNEMTKTSIIQWKKSEVSYREVVDLSIEGLTKNQIEDINFWPLDNLNHVETWYGEDEQTNRYYIGVFSREIEKKSEQSKGPHTYKKYLLFVLGQNNQVYELRNVGKILMSVYSLFGEKKAAEENKEENLNLEMLNFLKSIKSKTEEQEIDE